MTIRVTIWNEGRHEKTDAPVRAIYPDRIDGALAVGLADRDFDIERATLDDPAQGLPQELLDRTDVLVWWGHVAHEEVADAAIDRVQQRILAGMGLVVLHSGHHSKMFRRMMGTIPAIRSQRACPPISRFRSRRCMANLSTFRLPTKSLLFLGTKAGKCSAAG